MNSYSNNPQAIQSKSKQTGAALFTALVFLLILTLIGVTAMRDSGLSERMSSNAQVSQMAYQAAESAIDRYIAEYNYNVHSPALAEADVDLKIAFLSTYLPITTATSFFEYCLDQATSVKANYPLNTPAGNCGTTTIDGGQNAVSARNRVTYEGCPGSCPKYSLGLGKQKVSCHVLKMEAEGTVDQTTAMVDQWVTLQGPC
jgi:Tfp pilus assembly protein PilX